ncbi:hypothetical protein ACVIWV_005996 [Bradyrhizobium diazoefficiens]|uniref:Uncharacterized protein n=1 Tax=Bradyrhizobium diazoefficiens TaxID=1355477 RepID=A0A0E4FX62_9BRAD|nr:MULTISPECIES: hypothetical protein [Bradyrhizobium]MBR0860897.1 hypothetical protein [Bradyrhizobium diazoefficiens]MBR0885520.1 hypothetical protein [Bradyrhizobium diazoefficiens]MBR0917413.1 hypothetical protein [Bradyrhizobium diazoefficiens]MBR0941028.1 hypothetical protein [Bradyrhizobium liaoningense]WLA65481.1 hypothetical protein QNN01_00850 [Bradyrhizobium diazoefficiens]
MISTTDKLRCVLREISYRKHVYRRRVADGFMTEAQANREIELMEAIAIDYRTMAAAEAPQTEMFTEKERP